MPLDVATAMSARVWRFVAPKTRRHRRALKNLEKMMPEKTPEEREAIALGMWDNLGRVMAETFLLHRILKDPWRIELENPALIERYRDKTGATVIASLHMGNWEVGIWPAGAFGARAAGVYRMVENAYVDAFLQQAARAALSPSLSATKSNDGFNTVMRIAAFDARAARSGCWPTSPNGRVFRFPFSGI